MKSVNDYTSREQQIIKERKSCYQGIRRKERTAEKVSLLLIFSWLFTGPCILFMFIAPTETVKPFLFFSAITAILYFIKYNTTQEIINLNQWDKDLSNELNEIHFLIKKQKSNLRSSFRPSSRAWVSSPVFGNASEVEHELEDLRKIDQQLKIERNRELYEENRGNYEEFDIGKYQTDTEEQENDNYYEDREWER